MVMDKEPHAPLGRIAAATPGLAVMRTHDRTGTSRLQIAAGELAKRRERLGSGSEVDRFRVVSRHGLFIEAFAPREAPQLFDQLGVGASVGRAHSDIHAGGGSFLDQVMRSARARMYLEGQYLGPAPREDLNLRNDARADAVADEASFRVRRWRSPAVDHDYTARRPVPLG